MINERKRNLDLFGNLTRVVIKLGTGILTNSANQIDFAQIDAFAAQSAFLKERGIDVIIVSSGAVGAGMGTLGFQSRPTSLGELQACAAIGQVRLMHAYSEAFKKHGIHVAQVLLTHEDLKHKDRHLNARNTLESLLGSGAVPIVNENDAVSFTELQFGDNDKLSALVACLLPADLLVILTSADGLIENFGLDNERRINTVEKINDAIFSLAKGTTSATAKGGMRTKVEAAEIATHAGLPLFIGPGRDHNVLNKFLSGENIGTLFIPNTKKLKSHKRWIAFYHHPSASIHVDEGAEKALRKSGKSLLLPGIKSHNGSFKKGDVVKICDLDGKEFARGVVDCSAEKLNKKHSSDNGEIIIHRDHLVLL